MAKMLSNFTLRDAPNGAKTQVGVDAEDIVEILETRDGWHKIRDITLLERPEGWVPVTAVDAGAVADTKIDKAFFAKECIQDALYVGINAHLLMAMARVRMGIANDQNADISNGQEGGRVGPFRLAQEEWDKARTDPEFDFDFSSTQIAEWRPQCLVVAVRIYRAQNKLYNEGNKDELPSAVDLYRAVWPGDQAKLPDDLQKALDGTADAIKTAAAKIEDVPPADPALPNATDPAAPATPKPKTPMPSPTGDLFNDTAPRIMSDLMPVFGLSSLQAAAILGNLGHECGGFKLMQEVKPLGGKGGYGWAQWTGPRRRSFFAFCQAKGLSPDSYDGNLGYLVEELSGAESRGISSIKSAGPSLEEMVKAFELNFERAHRDFKHYDSRNKYANKALAAFNALP